MKSNIITLKIKYSPENGDLSSILKYLINYNNVLRYTYNRIRDTLTSTKELTASQKSMNNVFVDSHFKNSAIYDAKTIVGDRVIFGGKKLFKDRISGKISKEEFRIKRLRPLCSIGEANRKANRKFRLLNENKILIKPSKKEHIVLTLTSAGRNYAKKLLKLKQLQDNKELAITYKLDLEYIYLSFDNSKLESYSYKTQQNRTMAIDLNPNYIGYSVVDWLSDSKYRIVDSGVFDLSKLNKKDRDLHVSSASQARKHMVNKRKHELAEIAHALFRLCKHYSCARFGVERLDMRSKDLEKGRKLNRLVNNQWAKSRLFNILKKLISSSSTIFMEVAPQYSSVIGNLVYRSEKLPDMVLASIEIGRRATAFDRQYLSKIENPSKTIIFPKIDAAKRRIERSLEELSCPLRFESWKDLLSRLKKLKPKYRLLLESCDLRVSSFFHKQSMVFVHKA